MRTTRRSVMQTGAKLAYATPLVAATLKLSTQGVFAAISGRGGTDCSGQTWDEFEYYDDLWHGTWTRTSGNHFAATWTDGTSVVTADLAITVDCADDGAVHVVRTNSSDGNDCIYVGTYNGAGVVSGTYTCTCCPGDTFPWHATIS
jgi:hypothetical protein